MENMDARLHELFASPSEGALPPDVLGELQSMLRLHSISPQELFYKWESYSMKMGAEDVKLDLKTARAFKVDLQEALERENRSKSHLRTAAERRGNAPTSAAPRNRGIGGDGDILDGLIPKTPRYREAKTANGSASLKRKVDHEPPRPKEPVTPAHPSASTPGRVIGREGGAARHGAFADRANAGQVTETLNDHLPIPDPPLVPPAEPRVKLLVNTDIKKFSYRPMAMHLSEASEVLDDRIDDFATFIQAYHDLPDDALGNAAAQSTSEVVAVGRIASDALEGKLNVASLVLEMSRRVGAGLRVPLKFSGSSVAFEFFPGQIVALRGVNASDEYFTVQEVLTVPLLPVAASTPASLDLHHDRLRGGPSLEVLDEEHNIVSAPPPPPSPLHILIGAGPYTTDDNLAFDGLAELCAQAESSCADVLILTGPFLDLEHPLVAAGDIDLPADVGIDPDTATLTTVFRVLITPIVRRLAERIPAITIILVPSVRDVISKHVSWPQEPLSKKELGLPRVVKLVSNPVTVSLNEVTLGLSSLDILSELRQSEVVGRRALTSDILQRLPRYLIEQRHFFPLFPPAPIKSVASNATAGADADADMDAEDDVTMPMGAMLDPSYLKLGEWLNVRPDVLITPSNLPPFARVVASVLVINPGTVSKRRAPGTYARLVIQPATLTEAERAAGLAVAHKVFERARVDIVRI
ncbi:MAG: DNA-directed DNA polymerase alpha subunit pol12 [Phylliscum demangeonii]|nr:MAG: DNA-directed DNA polymerase alpha subunit pol12 [Phylliscum demangeonii]